MQKTKEYHWVKFTPEAIQEALEELRKIRPATEHAPVSQYHRFIVSKGTEKWNYDNEAEFFADYGGKCDEAEFSLSHGDVRVYLWWFADFATTTVGVEGPTRGQIESVFHVFESKVAACAVPQPKPLPEPPWESRIKVFIGHGRDEAWRDLKDHLEDKQHIHVEAYEIGSRTGLHIGEVLDDMLTRSSFAILVLTGEVEDTAGELHARDNVIHELGLFQGRLGFRRAIVLLEEGVAEFSNIYGTQQLRFPKSHIKETFGDVLAVLKREFGTSATQAEELSS